MTDDRGENPSSIFEHHSVLCNASPQIIHVLVPRTRDCVAFYDKGDLADVLDVTELGPSGGEVILDYLSGPRR